MSKHEGRFRQLHANSVKLKEFPSNDLIEIYCEFCKEVAARGRACNLSLGQSCCKNGTVSVGRIGQAIEEECCMCERVEAIKLSTTYGESS